MGYLEKRVGFFSDAGDKPVNEDSIICISNEKDKSDVECLLGIADGLSNKKGGKFASVFIKEELEEFYSAQKYKGFAESIKAELKHLAYIYKMSIGDINKRLYELRHQHVNYKDMGASFTGFLGYEMELYLAHVGHLKAYQIRGGKVKDLTQPHIIGKKVNKTSPPSCYKELYRYIGFHPWVKIDFQTIKVEANDLYVVCSNGFYNYVDEKSMLNTMMNLEYNPQKSSEALVALAKQNGAAGNISVACVFYMNYMGLEVNSSDRTRLNY